MSGASQANLLSYNPAPVPFCRIVWPFGSHVGISPCVEIGCSFPLPVNLGGRASGLDLVSNFCRSLLSQVAFSPLPVVLHWRLMRFCLVSTQEHWGGGEVLMASMASALRRAGHTLAWITREASQVESSVRQQDGKILYCLRKRGRNLQDYCAVRRVLCDWAPDVLLMNDTHAVMLAGLAAAFCPSVKPVRIAYKHTVFPLRSKFKYRMLTDKVVCVSKAARDIIVDGGLAREDAVVVYGGAEVPNMLEDARPTVRRELGLADHVILLVSVGNLLDCKGHSDLLSAISRLRGETPVLLVIAGEGDQRSRLEGQIQQLGLQHCVRLLGYRDDANRLLQAADIVVHPSHAEGLSLVLIQAQMLKKPIVATAVGGASEVLGVGEAGCSSAWVAEPRNATDLAERIDQAIRTLHDDSASAVLSRRLDGSARRARETFSLANNSSHLADLAASLL